MTARGWAVVGPSGELCAISSLSEVSAWSRAVNLTQLLQATLEALGYRCVRVTVTVEDEQP